MTAISFSRRETPGLVSIVIPAYRSEQFIADTLASVGKQTYPHWEVVVVEDGSRDATERIVADFARRHPSFHVDFSRNERNSGAAHTRNVAFARAGGEFVAMLDADDRWYPDHLALMVDGLQKSRKDIAYASMVMVEDQTNLLLGVWGPDASDLADFPHSLLGRNYVNPSAVLLRRRVLVDVGPWNTACRYCEDYDFWLRCIAVGKQFHYVGGCHGLYRKNHAGATTQRTCGTVEEFADIGLRFLHRHGLRTANCRRHVSKAFFRAAQLHAQSDPRRDPSADRCRAASLMLRAWRLRPASVGHLLHAARFAVGNLIQRRVSAAPAAAHPTSSRAAA